MNEKPDETNNDDGDHLIDVEAGIAFTEGDYSHAEILQLHRDVEILAQGNFDRILKVHDVQKIAIEQTLGVYPGMREPSFKVRLTGKKENIFGVLGKMGTSEQKICLSKI